MIGVLVDAKKVITHDLEGNVNGSLIELYKDGEKTTAYLTTLLPGKFKGYHLHRVRIARYVCLRGKVKITLSAPGTKTYEEHILDANTPQRLRIAKDIATGLENVGDEEVWLINFPDPPYDPNLKDEQVEYTREDLDSGIVK